MLRRSLSVVLLCNKFHTPGISCWTLAHCTLLNFIHTVVLRVNQSELTFSRGSPDLSFQFRNKPKRCFVAPFLEQPPRARPQFLALERNQFTYCSFEISIHRRDEIWQSARLLSDQWFIWEPSQLRYGWQHTPLRSRSAPLVGIPVMCFPTTPHSRFDSSLFRVPLLRRVVVSPGIRFEKCLRRTNTGHDERARDLDFVPQNRADARRLEVVADGLPLFHGAQRPGHHSRFAAETRRSQVLGGLALLRARRRKELMCPE